MGLIDFFKNLGAPAKQAYGYGEGYPLPTVDAPFDGEKNFGEMGQALDYTLYYDNLAARSWQAYTDNDIAEMLVNEFVEWTIGTKLRLEASPRLAVLASEGVSLTDKQVFTFANLAEARFDVHSSSKQSTYSKEMNLQELAREVIKNAALDGDVLVVLRVSRNTGVNAELINGRRVQTPSLENIAAARKRGNRIRNGVEVGPTGAHVAYWVAKAEGMGHTRVPVKGARTGRTQAFLVYHRRYKKGYERGVGLLTPILEKLKKLDRYTEAMVGSAEERAKIVYQIVHEAHSDGQNPLWGKLKAQPINNEDIARGTTEATAQQIAQTSGKETYNMGVGAELKALDAKIELSFKEFITTNINLICASRGIPPEVALKMYNSNYSASRMASKSWEATLFVKREDISTQFYKPFYNLFLHMEILGGKISAPGYLEAALVTKNHMTVNAYRGAKFIGANVPSVDPVKDAKAARERLGPLADNVPLSTPERETEQLGTGDYTENAVKFETQISKFKIE